MAFYFRNKTSNSVPLDDLGIVLSANESRLFYTNEGDFEFSLDDVQESMSLYNAINNNLVVIYDGVTEYTKQASLDFSTPVSKQDVSQSVGITETQHADLSTFLHNLAVANYKEITRNTGLISSIIIWSDSGKTRKIRELELTRTNSLISSYIIKQYDAVGNLKNTVTASVTRGSGIITSITEAVS